MIFKRLLAAVVALCLAVGLCACAGGGENTTTQANTTQTSTAETTQETTEAALGGYRVTVVDEGGNPIAGAMVQLCLDACYPAATDDSGVAKFAVEEADYKVSLLALPEGYTYTTDAQEFYFAEGSLELTITLKAIA